MNENEEMVYSQMGLDPILLLEEPPLSENYIVNIIRPGFDAVIDKKNEVLEEIQQSTPIKNNDKNISRWH